VSGEDSYCGGAVVHSAVCDFDQNRRPIVGKIVILTRSLRCCVVVLL
jgi:hypothetical protein